MCHFVCGTNPSPLGDENLISDGIEFLITVVNQPIPTRGRKSAWVNICCSATVNQPIPKRGQKLLKTFIFFSAFRTNPSPDGDENIEFVHAFFAQIELTHPHSGTKILIRKNQQRIAKNQPIPTRGRKKHLPKSVGALSYDMKFMCLTMEYILQIYF